MPWGALVSPANSYGHMDGGIDEEYIEYFGSEVQQRVYGAIARLPHGLLPVGSGLLVHTGDERIPHLIVAPTMVLPEPVPAVHAYQAMSAVLRVVERHAGLIGDVFCPGLATGVGQVPFEDAAREMALAYHRRRERFHEQPRAF